MDLPADLDETTQSLIRAAAAGGWRWVILRQYPYGRIPAGYASSRYNARAYILIGGTEDGVTLPATDARGDLISYSVVQIAE